VLRGQLDTSARIIWAMEKLGLVHDVRWPVKERIDAKLVRNQTPSDVPTAA
jgi:stearoyl-CoA desaturase (delta-9 desaturase)